jgi:hypothetical protein
LAYFDPENDHLFCSIRFAIWNVDKCYDSFPVDPLEWLNIAGKLANKQSSDDVEAYTRWRDYQYQLIYHLCQTEGKKMGKDKILYVSNACMEENYR